MRERDIQIVEEVFLLVVGHGDGRGGEVRWKERKKGAWPAVP